MELPEGIEINDDKFEKLSKKEKDKYILELLDKEFQCQYMFFFYEEIYLFKKHLPPLHMKMSRLNDLIKYRKAFFPEKNFKFSAFNKCKDFVTYLNVLQEKLEYFIKNTNDEYLSLEDSDSD